MSHCNYHIIKNTYNFKTPIENCKPNTKVIEHNKNKINQTQQEIEDYCKLHKTKQNCNSSTLDTVSDVCKWQDSHNLVLNDYDDNVKNTDTNELLITTSFSGDLPIFNNNPPIYYIIFY